MATDYDARRGATEGDSEEAIEELKTQRGPAYTTTIDIDETEAEEEYELPGADLSGEELQIRVIPPQKDEFTCMSCYLVRHRSQIAAGHDGLMLCKECLES